MSLTRHEPSLFIDGRWVPGHGPDAEVENPATEETIAEVTQADLADTDDAVAAAGAAFRAWSTTPVQRRVEIVATVLSLLRERAGELAACITDEQGSPPQLAESLHVGAPIAAVEALLEVLPGYPFRTTEGNSLIVREPVGVLAAITPWNMPLHQIVVKVLPAIAAGATVVLKPAELTPLTAFRFVRLLADAGLPAGVVNLVTGPGATVGDHLAGHPGVDQVSFTGSTSVGRHIAARAAATVKRVTLELGGKSASLVLSDIDDEMLATAVKVTVADCFLNAGQTCTALSRLVVPRDRVEQVEAIAAQVAGRYIPGKRLGPLISARQRSAVLGFAEPARRGDATVVYDGADRGPLPERGHYVAPLVLGRVGVDAAVAQEEVFGPVLSIMSADSDEHAVEIANSTVFGLSGAVWSGSTDRAEQIALRLRTGQVAVNGGAFNFAAPFGGYRQSGIGRELGGHGLADVLETKAVQR